MAAPISDSTVLPGPNRGVVITTLGVTQIFAWGSSYYLPAVLAKPIAAETGWPLTLVVGGVSVGLLAAGLVSPRVGRTIGRDGGRPVLAASSVLLAIGLMSLGLARSPVTYVAAWLVLGLGMGAGLYDAAFATLGRYYGKDARSAITTLTLWGGFASTVCWPLSAYLVETLGWRGACLAYAALQLGLALPAHLLLLPPVGARPQEAPVVAQADAADPLSLAARDRRAFLLMASLVTIGGAATSLFSVHLLTLLQARDLPLAIAVALGALVGPSQVGARVVEMAFGRHYHPVWTMLGAAVLMAVGLVLLAAGFPLLAVALVAYGCGNGIYSIARGTVPLALFGPERYAGLVGRLAMPSLLAQALAPSAGALLIERAGAASTFAILAALTLVNVALAIALVALAAPARRSRSA